MISRCLVLAVPLSLLLGACTYGTDNAYTVGGGGGGPSLNIEQSTIDTDSTIAGVTPGEGAGAFVEYASGGTWHLFTACDTAISGYSCDWDVIVDADGGITSFTPDRMEQSDTEWVDWGDQGTVRFVATTSKDEDGFFFTTRPGATGRIDVYLDQAPAPRYIYWVGDGGLHRGAPTNPIDLTPSAD